MDFKKILATFLFVFVIIDAFLVMQWVQLKPSFLNPTSNDSVLNEMRNDGIQVMKLDNSERTGVYLAGRDGSAYLRRHVRELSNRWTSRFADNQMTVTLDEPIALAKKKTDAQRELERILADDTKVIAGNQYRFNQKLTDYANQATDDVQVMVFTQRISQKRTFITPQAQIRFVISHDHHLLSYTQTYIANPRVLRDATTLLSEKKALLAAYQYNEIPNNSHVKWGQLGYVVLTTVEEDVIFVPAWTFSIMNAAGEVSIVHINALNGALMP